MLGKAPEHSELEWESAGKMSNKKVLITAKAAGALHLGYRFKKYGRGILWR